MARRISAFRLSRRLEDIEEFAAPPDDAYSSGGGADPHATLGRMLASLSPKDLMSASSLPAFVRCALDSVLESRQRGWSDLAGLAAFVRAMIGLAGEAAREMRSPERSAIGNCPHPSASPDWSHGYSAALHFLCHATIAAESFYAAREANRDGKATARGGGGPPSALQDVKFEAALFLLQEALSLGQQRPPLGGPQAAEAAALIRAAAVQLLLHPWRAAADRAGRERDASTRRACVAILSLPFCSTRPEAPALRAEVRRRTLIMLPA